MVPSQAFIAASLKPPGDPAPMQQRRPFGEKCMA